VGEGIRITDNAGFHRDRPTQTRDLWGGFLMVHTSRAQLKRSIPEEIEGVVQRQGADGGRLKNGGWGGGGIGNNTKP